MDKEEYKMNNFVLCQNETFNKFSVITWWSVSLLEETEYYKETANEMYKDKEVNNNIKDIFCQCVT
jgi:hypothetical protein